MMSKEDAGTPLDSNSFRGSGNDSTTTGGAGSGSAQTSDVNNKGSASSKTAEDIISQAENKAVFRIRLLVFSLLLFSTVTVAILVYYFTLGSEVEAFEAEFLDDSEKVFEALGTTLSSSLGAVDAYAISLVSFARYSNSTWPLVVMPDFGARMAKMRTLSKAFLFGQFQVVAEEDRSKWEKFSIENSGWVDEVMKVQKEDPSFSGAIIEDYSLSPLIYSNTGIPPNGTGPYYPTWQQYPSVPVFGPPFNWDGSYYPSLQEALISLENDREAVIGSIPNLLNPNDPNSEASVAGNNYWVQQLVGDSFDHTEPYVDIFYPVFEDDTDLFPSYGEKHEYSNGTGPKLVSVLTFSFYWRNLIEGILPPGSDGTLVVIENTCGQSFTYAVNGPSAVYKGSGDLHDQKYKDFEQISKLNDLKGYNSAGGVSYTGYPLAESSCPYTVKVYPSEDFENRFLTKKPIIYTATAVAIFLLTTAVFWLYDLLVERRQQKVMKSATQSNAIVSSLFPSNVRKRLYDMENQASKVAIEPQKTRLKSWLSDGKDMGMVENKSNHSRSELSRRPIADLFPETTVLFADISGFTAWSSIREPSQVFVLLENVYSAFDSIATRRKVFKVETIGDSYVAVAGLPEPRADHAVVMAKFANDCRIKMTEVTRELGVTLGPDTEDLSMRFGLHSGPVTAGVLRGQKSRFQLFGDTVNTAARMESTGSVHRIQVSQVTADYLVAAKKTHWIVPREDQVEVKGKGMMQTYWVEVKGGTKSVANSVATTESFGLLTGVADSKLERLVEWNVDVLARLIKYIIHRREAVAKNGNRVQKTAKFTGIVKPVGGSVLSEVKEIIELPDYDGYSDSLDDSDSVVIDPEVMGELREFVVAIATSYEMNPFHNFEHASHVCMSVAKLMSRIISADDAYEKAPGKEKGTIEYTKHDHTYGITSDPLTQFACVFSALIHDVEHPGVPNTQLVKEETRLSIKYHGRSVAEQNSVDVSWSIFMEERFSTLRSTICPTENEMKRFRQLVVNCVMATDIMDKELKALRNSRWDRAFSEAHMEEPDQVSRNRKATIVIEHLLQASDVAHTMQHWHIYRKWNERLFEEMHVAYKQGRADKDPADFWYQGEMGFFDFYIIPLAKKLSECGVFGVSSDEYLNYATKNREEWERRGQEVVAGMVERLGSSMG